VAKQITLTLYVQNAYEHYEDEDHTIEVTLPAPTARDIMADDLDEWREDNIFPLTGSASGTKTKGNSWYDVEVKASSHPELIPVGTTWDWGY
jgi:hypothetical protein